MNQNKNEMKIWADFAQRNNLSEAQLAQFKKFYQSLVKANELFNLTNITELKPCLSYHFEDSLIIQNFFDLSKINGLVDIGSGAGFPGVPIKIMFPHINMILIEVNKKRIEFLNNIIKELKLKNIEVYSLDWRTFLRKTNYKVELFCTRASLKPAELVRMFKPACFYKNSKLVYWAAQDWNATKIEEPFIVDKFDYQIKNKKRKLVLFSLKF